MPDRLTIWWAPLRGTAQAAFFDDDTPDAALLFCGGWGSGKTMTLWGKVLKLSALNAPLPLIWLVPQYSHVHEVLLPKLEEVDGHTGHRWFLEPDQFTYQDSRYTLDWCGGGPILFKSAEHAEAIQGQQVAAAAVDEPAAVNERAWRNVCARVRHPQARLRQVVAAGTASDLSWMQTYFFDTDRPSRYRRYEMSTRDNTELLAQDPGYVERILEHASAAEVRAFVDGHGVRLDGQPAYPEFDERLHWREGMTPDRSAPLVLTCDFNVAPMCWVIGQQRIGPAGPEAHLIDGITLDVATTERACDVFVEKYPRWPAGIHVYGDCNGRNRDVRSHKSNYTIISERLKACGPVTLHVPTHNPPVASRLAAVNRLLKNAHGATRLWIRKTAPSRQCPTRPLVRSLQQTIIAPGKQDVQKKPGETITHAGDALGYWIAKEWPVPKPEIRAGMSRIDWLL